MESFQPRSRLEGRGSRGLVFVAGMWGGGASIQESGGGCGYGLGVWRLLLECDAGNFLNPGVGCRVGILARVVPICSWNARASVFRSRSWAEGDSLGPGDSICAWNMRAGVF